LRKNYCIGGIPYSYIAHISLYIFLFKVAQKKLLTSCRCA
jgi:hypothetical protein